MKNFYEKGLSYAVRQAYLKGILLAFFLLGLSSARMQGQVSSYVFSQATGTYNSIASVGSVVTGSEASTSTTNDTTGWNVTIPFTFNFNGSDYTSLYVNSNGGVTFGSTTSNATTLISTSTAYEGAIAVMNRDLWGVFITSGVTTSGSNVITNVANFYGLEVGKALNAADGIPTGATVTAFDTAAGTITMSAAATSSSAAAVVRYGSGKVFTHTEGTAPNRVFVIEWSGYNDYGTTVALSNYMSFQLRLSETTNVVSIVYGDHFNTATTVRTNQIGLRGASNSDFNNRVSTTGWTNTTVGTANNSSVSRDNVNFPASGLTFTWTPSTCIGPAGMSINTITTTSAGLSWNAPANPPANGYTIYYSTTDGSPSVSTVLNSSNSIQVPAGTVSATLSPLSPSSAYYVWIRSECSATESSQWKNAGSFATVCIPSTIPYSQNFDTTPTGSSTVNNAPVCWTYYETSGSTGYGYVSSSSTNVLSSPNAYYLYRASTTTGHVMLISPETPTLSTGAHRVRFSAKATVAGKELQVGTMTDPANIATFTVLQTIPLTTTYTEYDVNFPAGTAAYFAFNNATAGSASAMYIDDVFVEPVPSCYPPSTPAFDAIGSSTVAVNWTAPTSGTPASSYTLYYSTTNTAPDATTVLNASNSVTATGTSGTITGLTPNTTYYVWMRSNCAAPDVSLWVPVGTVLTACTSVSAPWTYTVETATASTGAVIADCWTTIPSDTTTLYRWNVDDAGSTPSSSTGPSGAHSGVKYFYTEASSGSTGSIAELYTPFINVSALTTPSVQFYYHMYGSTMGELRVDVYDGASWNNDLFVLTGQQQTSDTSPWLKATVNLGSLNITGDIRVRFRAFRGTDFYGDMALDDISVVEAPTCVAPTNVNVVSFLSTTATIGWDAATIIPANGYQVYYSTVNTAPDGTTVLDATNSVNAPGLSANLTGLTPATTYYVWVRSDCGAGNVSDWTQIPVTFVTLCAPVSTLFENFDSYATGSIVPQCWVRIAPATGAGSQTISSSSSPASGLRHLYQNASTSQTPVIVVLPEFTNINAGTHWLRFQAKVSTAPGALEVGYMMDVTDANTFVNLTTLDITNTAYDGNYYTVQVPAWVPANARLAVRNPADAKSYYWDDVYWEAIPSCYAPTDLVLTGATSSSLDISWSAPVGSPTPVQGYEYYYSQTNTPPTAATPASGTSSATSVSINGLTGDTVYYVWVRSVCSATDTSSWSPMLEATTGYCTPVQTGTSTTYYLANATTTGAITDLNYTATSHQTYVNTAEVFSAYPTQTFDFFLDGSGTSTYYYYIWVDWNNNLNFDDPGETILATTTKAATHTGNLIIPAGTPVGMYRVRIGSSFSGVPTNACGVITSGNYVDVTLNVVPPPSCVAPTNIQVTNVTHNSATIGWDASITPPAMGYDIYYSTTNTPPTATSVPQVQNAPGLSADITGLAPITTYYVWVRSHCSGTDQSFWTSVPVTVATLCQPPAITGTTSSTSATPMCMNDTATLTATADAGANITWYDAPTGGNEVGTGATFTTPALAASTNYYAAASFGGTQSAALTNATSTTGYTQEAGLFFDASASFVLEGVYVYPIGTGSGDVVIALQDGSVSPAVTLQTVTVTLTGSGAPYVKTFVPLNFNIVPGTNYKLMMMSRSGGVASLVRESGSAWGTYPLTIPSVLSITNGNCCSGNTTSASYYYFYDWQISTKCEGARVPVAVDVNTGCSLSTSEITKDDQLVKVYPNPFTDVINISDAKNLKSVTVTDASGRMVKTIANPGVQIHLGELKSGLYLLKLSYADGNTKTVKVIKR